MLSRESVARNAKEDVIALFFKALRVGTAEQVAPTIADVGAEFEALMQSFVKNSFFRWLPFRAVRFRDNEFAKL